MNSSKQTVMGYEGEGLGGVFDNSAWFVGIKNYKEMSGIERVESVERHLLTDEIFIPVIGSSMLIVCGDDGSLFSSTVMEAGKCYCVAKGSWHTVIMVPGAKLALVEASGTGSDNTENSRISISDRLKIVESYKKAISELSP